MKKTFLFLLVIYMAMTGCKKNDVGTYYFQYTLGGNHYLYNNQQLQLSNNAYNTLVGLVPDNTTGSDAAGITVSFGNDSATGANVLALAGKTFNFNANAYPQLSISVLSATFNYANLFTDNSTYSANISNVNFLKYDTSAGLDIYAVKGTFKAKLWNAASATPDTIGDATGGSFNIQCTVNHF